MVQKYANVIFLDDVVENAMKQDEMKQRFRVSDDLVVKRTDHKLIKGNKGVEFFHIIHTLTGTEEFNDDEWQSYYDPRYDGSGYCICGHRIRKTFVTEHESDIKFLVGSHCVNKLSKNQYNILMKGTCIREGCKTALTDRRKSAQKHGFCSDDCMRLHRQAQPAK